MTRKEAINILEQYREKPTLVNEIETVEEAVWLDEALEMAIKALEQEPCEDTISREVVIEWLKAKDIIKLSSQEETARKELKALPSVNPQDPKYCDRNICVSNEYNNIGCDECEVTKSQEPSSSEKPNKWIPVSERLPEDGQSVLFCDIDNDIMIGYHVKGRPDTHFSQDGTYEDMKNVRAWMPLPEPYKA